jgi:hypothetical protein
VEGGKPAGRHGFRKIFDDRGKKGVAQGAIKMRVMAGSTMNFSTLKSKFILIMMREYEPDTNPNR